MQAPVHLHIERVVIDEAELRGGPDAVRAAVTAQLPALLAAHGVPPVAAERVADHVTEHRNFRNP